MQAWFTTNPELLHRTTFGRPGCEFLKNNGLLGSESLGNMRLTCRPALSFPTPALNVFAGGTLLAVLLPLLAQLDVGGREVEAAALLNLVRPVLGWFLFVVFGMWVFYFSFPISRR